VGGDRKQVAVCSQNETFNKALRLLLNDFDVQIGLDPVELALTADLLVWQIDGALPVDRLTGIATSTPTLVLGSTEDLIAAVDAGCLGFLSKDSPIDEIGDAVKTVMSGGAVVPPHLLGELLRHMVQRNRAESQIIGADELTAREREVLQLAVEGLRKEDIGERLYISADTARTHLQRIYRKLGVHSQAELIALAVGNQRIDPEAP